MNLEDELRQLAARYPKRFGRGKGLVPFTDAVDLVQEVERMSQRADLWGCPKTARALRSIRYLLFDDDAAAGTEKRYEPFWPPVGNPEHWDHP